jgi:hypothetical protein
MYKNENLEGFQISFNSLIPKIADLMPLLSASTAWKVPAISFGWSTANPHRIKSSLWNILGNI